MKKLCLLVVFLVFFGFLVSGDTAGQEEVDHLLFLPNSSNRFVNEEEARVQLDNVAKYLKDKDLGSGQISVYGYAADAVNDIEPVSLSRDRALFVMSELQKRGLSKDLFAAPVAYGSVDLWGANTNEKGRSPNRRVRIMVDGSLLTPAVVKAAEPEIKTPAMDTNEAPIQYESTADESGFKFPWVILLFLILLAIIAAIILLAAKRRRSSSGKAVQEAAPPARAAEPIPPKADIVPVVVPAAPSEKIYVLCDDEVRLYAYGLYGRRNGENGLDVRDWYQSELELTASYEAQGYRVIRKLDEADV